jgi:uncharacterized Zn-finger protein
MENLINNFNHDETITAEDIKKKLKLYSCDICGKAFNKNYNLNKHKKIHTGEKPYSCDVCEKAFLTKSNLANHERVHTGEKPFECEICQESFSRNFKLSKHKKSLLHLQRLKIQKIAFVKDIKVEDIKKEVDEEEGVDDPLILIKNETFEDDDYSNFKVEVKEEV